MNDIKTYEGTFIDDGESCFAIVATRFNHFVVDRLVEGAIDALRRHGVGAERITVTHVPGAWELPLACQRHARGGKAQAVIALGAVIRGATPHFDYVAGEAAKGTASVMMETGVPIAFGVLTTDTIEQAVERAGTKAGNKGGEAAMAALEMVGLGNVMKADGI